MRRLSIRAAALAGLLVLLPFLARAGEPAEAEDIEARWVGLRRATLEKYHALARWCRAAKIFAVRAQVYEEILELDPDDPTARKWLRYELDKEGNWVRKANYTPPKNLGDAFEAFAKRRAQIGQWFAEAAEQLVRDAEAAGFGWLTWEVAELGLNVDPTNVKFREWNGEVQDSKAADTAAWILVETLRSRERSARLRKTALDAVANVPSPKVGMLTQADRVGGGSWDMVVQGDRVRVVGEPGVDELGPILRNADATWAVFHEAFDIQAAQFQSGKRYGKGLTVYAAADLESGNRFLAAQPGVTERRLAFAGRLVALWLPTRAAVLLKSPRPLVRMEGAPRQIFQRMIGRHLRLGTNRAWAREALALYLTWQITGTRFLSSVTDVQSRYGEAEKGIPEYKRKLAESDSDWFDLGRQLIESPDKPDLLLLAGKDLNHLTVADVLYAWCIVAYVVEGHPERAARFFRILGGKSGTNLQQVFIDTLGFDVRTLERRVHRWLDEVTAGSAGGPAGSK